MKQLKVYRAVLKEEGWSGLVKKSGKPVAIGLFIFFLFKGLLWLFLLYGGFELIFWFHRASLVDFYILLLQSLNLFKIFVCCDMGEELKLLLKELIKNVYNGINLWLGN